MEKISEKFLLNHSLLGTCARNYRVFAVIMLVVWLILNIEFCTAIRISPSLKGVKKLVNLKIFVLIICMIISVKWLGIDSGMLKLIEKICEPFLGVITQCLSPHLKNGTFPHMLDRVWISDKDH